MATDKTTGRDFRSVHNRRRRRRRPPGVALLTLGLALSLLAGCAPPAGPLEVGAEITPFTLDQLAGGEFSSRDLRGDGPVVINFWATWCGPCIHEIPALREVNRHGAARVVSINLDRGGPAVIQPFVDEHDIDYPVLLGDLDVFTTYGGSTIPYTLILDDEMRLVQSFRALVSQHTLERAIAKARAAD
ncbi:MAG: TlpA disulfide reductase family protein [Acidobacteriota bacterium]